MLKQLPVIPSFIALTLAFAACESDDPETRPPTFGGSSGSSAADPQGGGGTDSGDEPGASGSDQGGSGTVEPVEPPGGGAGATSIEPRGGGGSGSEEPGGGSGGTGPAPVECTPLDTDYSPGADDSWPACISDNNEYHVINQSGIGAVGRVAAFEQIAELLGFGSDKTPSQQDFFDARVAYLQTEGIESRVVRREDEHYPPASAACNTLTAEQQLEYPERCVGPVKIKPILADAFQAGYEGQDPVENAAKIEGALLWFFYISSFKEATTCANAAQDCDSAWAKYTGGEFDRNAEGKGLSRYVKALRPEAHDRIWDALLGVRCWRDLDNPSGPAEDLELRNQVRAQLDRGLLFGLAQIVRDRAQALPSEKTWQTVKILGSVLDREATLRDEELAETLRDELTKDDDADVDTDLVVETLDALFPCP